MPVKAVRPKSLLSKRFHYCPGCHHGIIHRLVAEVIDELKIQDKTIGIAPVGCSVMLYDYFDVDIVQAAHGRAPAVATGLKRTCPESIVFSYQGDGDLASIGMAEIVHAAARGEKITVIFVNNAIYGMTGGQMAPTTLIGQEASTAPMGRKPESAGYPLRISELLASIEGVKYIARVSVHNPKYIREAKKAIKEAFQTQIEGKGFSIVEVLSACPTNWHMTPIESLSFIENKMMQYFPLGKYKTLQEVEKDA